MNKQPHNGEEDGRQISHQCNHFFHSTISASYMEQRSPTINSKKKKSEGISQNFQYCYALLCEYVMG